MKDSKNKTEHDFGWLNLTLIWPDKKTAIRLVIEIIALAILISILKLA